MHTQNLFYSQQYLLYYNEKEINWIIFSAEVKLLDNGKPVCHDLGVIKKYF